MSGIKKKNILLVVVLLLLQGTAFSQDFRIRGRLHMDAFFGIHEADTFSTGFNNRRARMGMGGKITDNWDGQVEVDFADGSISPADFRLRRSFAHGGRLWIGQFKVPIGLNELTSSNEITFIERSSPNNVIGVARRMGVAYELFGDKIGFKTMVYGRALGQRSAIEGDMPLGAALRVVFAPRVLGGQLHLAGAVAYEDLNDNNNLRLRDRPEARDSKGGSVYLFDLPLTEVNNTLRTGLELLYINGPFSIEGEYLNLNVKRNEGTEPSFSGFHVQTSYLLTGESRSYSKGAVGGIKPSRESGAWELAARYSSIDLNEGEFQGGKQDNITLGLNYYATSRLRFMMNFVFMNADTIEQSPVIGVVRAQYFF